MWPGHNLSCKDQMYDYIEFFKCFNNVILWNAYIQLQNESVKLLGDCNMCWKKILQQHTHPTYFVSRKLREWMQQLKEYLQFLNDCIQLWHESILLLNGSILLLLFVWMGNFMIAYSCKRADNYKISLSGLERAIHGWIQLW